MFVAVMNLYVSAFSIPIISKIDFYFEGKRQHRFVVYFQIFSTLLKNDFSLQKQMFCQTARQEMMNNGLKFRAIFLPYPQKSIIFAV